ncbi:MAG: class I SAM-dependent methyltransferase [Deltaproteobacteria bacterium]|nr:class I SAM-dependent methyltransferase [Deltaproteobacteria bacterium]
MSAEEGSVYDDWQATPAGRYLNGRIKSLILDLTSPRAGERLLDIGCGSGDHLNLFRKKGCDVTGIDPSSPMLDRAGQRLAHRADLRQGRAEDLPFSDNEFDIVTLITALEFTDDPGLAVAEAIRVCRGRVFIGVMNRFSLIGAQGHLGGLFDPSIDAKPRFFHLAGLTAMIRSQLQGVRIQWGSVIFLPWSWYQFGTGLEERLPVMRNPFGAFFGLSFPVTLSYQTIQQTIRKPVALNPDGRRPVPGVVSEWKNGS